MEKPHETPIVETPQTPVESVDAKLDRIEQSIAKVNDKVDGIEKTLPKRDPEADKQASKFVLATAFALLGIKLGALAAGKVGFISDNFRAYKAGGRKSVLELYILPFVFFKGKSLDELSQIYKHSGIGAGIGAFIGPVLGGVLGWTRGDRIDKPADLVSHPIQSFKKIFGPEPKKETPEIIAPAQTTETPATDTAAERNYHGKVQDTPVRELA